mmetsp:Transcript_9240/g.24293  ORF Transcript_9240/g.24293 Transcript_9240/m.24293 type:complete len:221 (+) Transcript_9240:368-1030(+)
MNSYGLSGCSLITLCTNSCVNSTRLCWSRYSRAALACPCRDEADDVARFGPFELSGRLASPSPPVFEFSSFASSLGRTAIVTLIAASVASLFLGLAVALPSAEAAASNGMVYWQSVRRSSPGRKMSRADATGSNTSTLNGKASEASVGKRNGLSAVTGAWRLVEPARTDKTQSSGMPSVLTTCSSMASGRLGWSHAKRGFPAADAQTPALVSAARGSRAA